VKEIVTAGAQEFVEDLLERDQWDRPKIVPPGGGKAKGYVRVSTMAETLSDSFGLNRWQQANVVKGMARRPDLVNAARVATSNKEIYEIVDLAGTLGENDVAARNGSTMHRLTECVDLGLPLPEGLPENILAMLKVYEEAMQQWETLDAEVFVINDKIGVGGSYDRRLRHKVTGQILIGDLKTGQNLEYIALKTTMQVAMYASGKRYTLDHERLPLEITDRDRGILIHLPWVDVPEEAECELRWLDLKLGRQAVREALTVRDLRKLKAAQILPRVK
jgi:hypothetical protein